MNKLLIFTICCLLVAGLAGDTSSTVPGGLGPYEMYTRHISVYPADARPGWHAETQGMTHDDAYWYITQKEDLWKIPLEFDLGNLPESSRIIHRSLDTYPNICGAGFDHLGDPDYYSYNGHGYLVIPLEDNTDTCGGPGTTQAVGVFRTTDSLDYLGSAPMNVSESIKSDGSWLAVDPQGIISASRTWKDIIGIDHYSLDWGQLESNPPVVALSYSGSNYLYEAGNPLTIQHSQGADFSESGDLLFVLTGGTDWFEPNDWCAIHVFDTTQANWQRIAVSSQDPNDLFYYECHPGCCLWEESEGVDVGDMDDKQAPGIQGQLHVLQLDDESPHSLDSVYFEHLSGVLYVDAAYGGGEGDGTRDRPYTTVNQALQFAWNGTKIKIQGGGYPETLTLSKYIQFSARGSAAVVGTNGSLWLAPSGVVNLSGTGQVKLYP